MLTAIRGASVSRYVNRQFYSNMIEEIKVRIESREEEHLGNMEALLFYAFYRMAILNLKEQFYQLLALI